MAKFLRNYWLSVLMGLTIIVLLGFVNHYRQMNYSLLQEVEMYQAEMHRIHVNMEICGESLTYALEERDAQREHIKSQAQTNERLLEQMEEMHQAGIRNYREEVLIRKLAEEFKYSQGNVDWKKLLQPADRPKQVKGNATVSKLPSFRPTFSTALIEIGVAHHFKGRASSHSMEEGLFSLFTKSA